MYPLFDSLQEYGVPEPGCSFHVSPKNIPTTKVIHTTRLILKSITFILMVLFEYAIPKMKLLKRELRLFTAQQLEPRFKTAKVM